MPRYFLPKINKYVTFAASIPVLLSGGLPYCFSVWSPTLKEVYNLSQSQLQLIGALHNLGGYMSFISGFVYDALEHRHHVGPRVCILCGGITNTIGFLGLYAAISQKFFQFSLWHIAALALIAGNGGAWFDTVCLTTNIRNFPSSRGTVVGLMKASVGLSASFYAISYTCGFAPHADRFLLFLAIAPAIIVIFIGIPLINFVPFVQESELDKGQRTFTNSGRLLFSYQIIATLAIYLMSIALVVGTHDIPFDTRIIFAIGAVMLLFPVLFIPYNSGGIFAKKVEIDRILQRYASHDNIDGEEESILQPLVSPRPRRRASAQWSLNPFEQNHQYSPAAENMGGSGDAGHRNDNADEQDDDEEEELVLATPSTTLADCITDPNAYLLAIICAIVIGNGLAFLNNVAQLVPALEISADIVPVLVSLFGICSCCGRLIFGAVPENCLHSHAVPRPVFLVANGVFSSLAFFALAFCTHSVVLQVLTCCIGLCFGAQWSLLPSLTSDIFGLQSFASIYTVLQLFPAIGGYILGAVLVGDLYQKALRKHGSPGSTACIGVDCFQEAFLWMAVLGCFATTCSVVLMMRTLKLYRLEVGALRFFDKEVLNEDPDALRQRYSESSLPGE